jgi:DNA polymerase-3 subunit delta'
MTAAKKPNPAPVSSSAAIIGHQPVIEFLSEAWRKQKQVHAYLLAGPAGVGKLAVAEWLARTVLGQESLESHPDFSLIRRGDDPKTGKPRNAIVIEQVHELRGRLALGPMLGGWKAAIVDGADRLNEAAANALLKTLEEPHRQTVMILTANSAEAVMDTIRSRCQVVRLNRVARQEIAAGLIERGQSPETADRLSRLCGGCPGLALELASRPERLRELEENRDRLMGLLESGLTERWQGLEKLLPNRGSFNESRLIAERQLGLMAELVRDALWLRAGLADRIIHVDQRERLTAWPGQFGRERLAAVLGEIDAVRRSLAGNVSPKTALALVASSLSGI